MAPPYETTNTAARLTLYKDGLRVNDDTGRVGKGRELEPPAGLGDGNRSLAVAPGGGAMVRVYVCMCASWLFDGNGY